MMELVNLIKMVIEEVENQETPQQFADRLFRMTPEERDNVEFSENPDGYRVWEARTLIKNMKPNFPKFKRIPHDYDLNMWYTHIANVNGVPYGLSDQYEDPDDDELFVWAFTNISNGDPYNNMTETTWGKGHEDEVMKMMLHDLESYN